MKHLFFISVICLSFVSFTSFANDTRTSGRALESFNNTFKGASDVNWTVVNNYYKASFLLNGQYVAAFYNEDGTLVATSRNITSLQLPVALQSAIKTDYEGFWISDLFEVNNQDGTTYYLTIENGNNKMILKSVNSFEWEIYKTHAKF